MGFTHYQLRFLALWDVNRGTTKQPHRVDFVFHRSDGKVVGLHPSKAADAHPVIGDPDDCAITKSALPMLPKGMVGPPAIVIDGPAASQGGTEGKKTSCKVHGNISQADQISDKAAAIFLATQTRVWNEECAAGKRVGFSRDLTDEREFPWGAWLTFSRKPARLDEHILARDRWIHDFKVAWLARRLA